MHTVTLEARSDAAPAAVLDALAATGDTDRAVPFRAGLLRWTQRDEPDPGRLRVTFTQVRGDLAELAGEWRLTHRGTGCDITFEARYALGVPIYDRIIEPLLAGVLAREAASTLAGVPGGATVVTGP